MFSIGAIDWSPFITYIDTEYPGAVPYIHALFILVPIFGWVCWMAIKILPVPNSVTPPLSDDTLKGKIPPAWYNTLHRPVVWLNQIITIMNWVVTLSLYRMLYTAITFFATDLGKSKKLDNQDTTISSPPPYTPMKPDEKKE